MRREATARRTVVHASVAEKGKASAIFAWMSPRATARPPSVADGRARPSLRRNAYSPSPLDQGLRNDEPPDGRIAPHRRVQEHR